MLKSLSLWLLLAAGAAADISLQTVHGEELYAVYKLPSGEEKKTRLDGYQGLFLPAQVKQTAVTVQDAAGSTVASGTLQNGRAYLVAPNHPEIFACGVPGSATGAPVQAVVLMNSLDQPYTVDLFGRAGVGGVQNVAVPVGYDA